MRHLLLTYLILISSAVFAARDEGKAALEQSIALYKNKQFKESLTIQRRLVEKYPKNGLYWFNFGTSLFMSEDYKGARAAFGIVERLKSPLAPAAKLYRAKSEIALNHPAIAKVLLQKIVSESRLPPGLRAMAEEDLRRLNPALIERHEQILKLYQAQRYQDALDLIESTPDPDSDTQMLRGLLLVKLGKPAEAHTYLAEVPESADADRVSFLQNLIDQTKREQRSRKPFWAYIEASGGYNSNSYYDSPDDGSLGALFMKDNWGGGARLSNRGSWAVLSGYSGYWEEIATAGNLKVVSHQLQLTANYDTPTDFLQVGPYYQYDEWAGIPAQNRSGVRIKYRRLWSTSAAGGEIDFTSIKGDRAPYSYLGGTDFVSRIYWAMDTKRIYGQIYFDYEKSRTGDFVYSDKSILPIAFEGGGPGVRLMYRQSDIWLLSLQTFLRRRAFFTLSVPGNRERLDTENSMSVRATRVWKPNFSSYLALTYLNNNSTLGTNDVRDENYDASVMTAGLMWDIL